MAVGWVGEGSVEPVWQLEKIYFYTACFYPAVIPCPRIIISNGIPAYSLLHCLQHLHTSLQPNFFHSFLCVYSVPQMFACLFLAEKWLSHGILSSEFSRPIQFKLSSVC